MNWWTWIGYGVGAWLGFNAAVVGVLRAGLWRIDRLAAHQQPAPCEADWDPWQDFDRVAAEKDEV